MSRYSAAVRQQKIAYWKQVIIDCRRSGMTATAYFRLHEISASRFYYWLSAIREELMEEHPEYLHQPAPAKDAQVIGCNESEEPSVTEDPGKVPCEADAQLPTAMPAAPSVPMQTKPSFVSVRMGNFATSAPLPRDKLMVSCGPFRFELTEDTPVPLLRKLAAAWRDKP